VIAEGDLLVHHPYDSFEASVDQFFAQAADDPDVLSIRSTLDSNLQLIAQTALRAGLETYDRRHGWRAPHCKQSVAGSESAEGGGGHG
jgi:membrane carboxypeptidase/penicillin-binding protein